MELKKLSRILALALAGGSFALTAFAQWQWLDKDGRKVFSDRSPPAEIQEKNILKRPPGSIRPAPAAEAGPAGTPDRAATPAPLARASAPKLTGKDADLEAKKKKAEEDEVAKKKADDEKSAATKAENCQRAKSGIATLQSGQRIATINANGEREIYDDAKRAAETQRTQQIIDSNCK